MLNKRLKAIAELIKPCDTLFDVGSDHGFLPLYLLLNKKINKAIIGEINTGPLDQAKKNFMKYPELNCEFVLSDGLNSYEKLIDTVVIAGMGFETIQHIIVQDIEKFKKIPQIVIQSNTKIVQLREFLNENNFEITDEEIIRDRKYFYPIVKVQYNNFKQQLTIEELEFGPILIKKSNNVFHDYLVFCKRIEENIIQAQKKESSLRIQIIERLLNLNKDFD